MVNRLSTRNDNKQNVKPIAAASLGLAFIAAYFYLVMQSPLIRYLTPHASKAEILAKAESFTKEFPAAALKHTRYEREISIELNSDLFQYAQYYKKRNHKFPDLSICHWSVRRKWNDKENSPHFITVTFDLDGNLTGFNTGEKNLAFEKPLQLSEEDALLEAKYFLESLNVNTEPLVIANKDISKTDTTTTYKFTLKSKIKPYPFLTDTHTFEIIGDTIVGYRWDKIVDWEKMGITQTDKEEKISIILLIITWLAVIFIIIVHFIKKLRKDELEFKRALWLGVGAVILVFITVAVEIHGKWLEMLLAGGASGVFVLIFLLILFPIAESRARETWPGKLEVTDLLFQGRIGVREAGTAILHSYFLTGLTLLLLGGVILAVTSLDIGYLSLSERMTGAFQTPANAISLTVKNIILSLFTGLVFLCFWPGYLRSKIPRNNLLYIFLLAVSFELAGLHLLFFHPWYLGAVLVFPAALAWAYFVYKFDLLTVLLSFIGINFLLDLVLLMLMPDVLFSSQGMAVIIFTVLFFGLGIYLVFRSRSAADYDSYVPEYVSRIAEKERFLKELEIARGVQMRFLPQKVPHFPSLEIVSLCQPAMEVGGDYYDFIRMNERYMTVLIGDVSGKGVSAAFYMTMVKGIIKTLSKKTKEPAMLLAEANEIFFENAPRDVFITIIYGVFDLKEKTLTVASAGHNPLIAWRHRTGKTELINPKGIALGLDRGERYRAIIEEKCIPIDEQDIFVFYTDGVSESMNTREEIYGEERLRALIEKYAHLSPQQLQEKIVESVTKFSGKAPQHDDLTMVVVKVRRE